MPMFRLIFTLERATHVTAPDLQSAKRQAEAKCEEARRGGITMRMHMIEEVVSEAKPD